MIRAALIFAPQLLSPSSLLLGATVTLDPMPLSVSAACPEQSAVQSGSPITRSSVLAVWIAMIARAAKAAIMI